MGKKAERRISTRPSMAAVKMLLQRRPEKKPREKPREKTNCRKCRRSFANRSILKKHQSEFHPKNEFTKRGKLRSTGVKCLKCNLEFIDRTSLAKHYSDIHGSRPWCYAKKKNNTGSIFNAEDDLDKESDPYAPSNDLSDNKSDTQDSDFNRMYKMESSPDGLDLIEDHYNNF